MTVRRAVPGDETTADWQRWLAPAITLILEEAGIAWGLAAGTHDAQDAGTVHLMAMWVHPALRGTGAADALVTEHLAWARTVGARLVRADVIATNARAHRLYERHGFRHTGPEAVREDGRVELQMELIPP